MPRTAAAALALLVILIGRPAAADPIAVKYREGITRGFPVLRSLAGDKLAQGETDRSMKSASCSPSAPSSPC